MEASAFSLDMPHPHDDPIPNAARMRALGDLLARGIRRQRILAESGATCRDLVAESSVTVPGAGNPQPEEAR
jgi:hypothetical protein